MRVDRLGSELVESPLARSSRDIEACIKSQVTARLVWCVLLPVKDGLGRCTSWKVLVVFGPTEGLRS